MPRGATIQADVQEALEIFYALEDDARDVADKVGRLVDEFGYTELSALRSHLQQLMVDIVDPHGYVHDLEQDLEEIEFDDVMARELPKKTTKPTVDSVPSRSAPMRGGRM